MRAISKSPLLSSLFEKFVVKWLLGYVEHQIDWAQYGAMKGCSVAHLMVELSTFIHYNLDLKSRQGVTLTCIDYSKAFNRQDHNTFLTILHSLNVPGWLIKIISGFLHNCTMVMSVDGGTSSPKTMPGGGPAGTTLGLLMFILLVNRTANPGLQPQWGKLLSAPVTTRSPISMTHYKLIDDASIAESIDMDKTLEPMKEEHWTRPLIRRSRFELAVPEDLNKTNTELVRVAEYAQNNYMKINIKKTKVLLFNPTRRGIDFQPEVKLDGKMLDVINQIRLVGFVLSDDLSWKKNTDSLVTRAYAKMWILMRLKALGASRKILRLIYFQHIQSILEFGAPAWNSALTITDSQKIECVQKVALRLIYGRNNSYKKLLGLSNLSTLALRRERLSLQFAKKAAKHPKFKQWFEIMNPNQPF